MTSLPSRLRDQAAGCVAYGSPLMGALLQGAAADFAAGGVVADLLGPHAHDPAGSALPLRFAGALHRLVLQRRAPELALHYPSVGGTAPVEALWPAAERICRAHLDELRDLVQRPVQTNEVGRSAVLFGVLQLLRSQVRLLELGASAGLNLRCDRYGYLLQGQVHGDVNSPVRLLEPWSGALPQPAPFTIVERRGCDPQPLDTTTTEGRLSLTSYVWGDQVGRLQRLRGALAVAAEVPAPVRSAGALEFLSTELASLDDSVTTVVWHSVVMQYVDPAERAAIDQLLAAAPDHVVRASMEPEKVEGGWEFRVHLQRGGGPRVHIADCHGHGPPVHWTGATV